MSLKDLVSNLLNSAPPATAGGVVVVETANMEQTPLVKLSMYIIAHGLWVLNRFKDDGGKAKKLIGLVENIFDPTSVAKYGFGPQLFKNNYTTPVHFQQRVIALKKAVKEAAEDATTSKEEIDVLKQSILFLEKPEDPSRLARIRKTSSRLKLKFGDNVAKVLAAAGEHEEEQESKLQDLLGQLNEVVRKMTGKPGIKVDATTLALEKNTSNRAIYRNIRTKLTALYDEEMSHFLATQPKNIAYVHEVYKHLDAAGFPFQRVPVFKRKVPLKVTLTAGKLQYLTESGKLLSASIPAGATKITFMSTYDEATGKGAYLSYTAPEAVSITRVYTTEHKAAATQAKFGKADQVVKNIDSYLTKWHKDLVSKDPYKKMGATIALIVYETGMRAGTRQNSAASATGVPTYGALSLRPRHIRISTASIIFKYEGKKGVAQDHKILLKDKWTKLIAKNLKEFLAGKRGDDLVFSFENERGTIKPMAPNRMTAYLNSTGYTVGLHKIRHVKGTALVVELLGKNAFKPTAIQTKSLAAKQRAAEEFVKTKIIMPVAALLGHRNKDKLAWRTSIGSYINPAPLLAFFDENGLRKPSWLPSKVEE